MEHMDCPEEFKQMMDNDSDDDESDNISETFICCVCRDLLYKPVVLGCGHVSCFWCVHKSMDGWEKSRCPICRNQYFHFPYVCQTLHFLLLKMHPIAYKRREKQTLGEEKEMGYFSPQLDDVSCHLQPVETLISSSKASLSKTGEILERIDHAEFRLAHQEPDSSNTQVHQKDIVATGVSSLKDHASNQLHSNGTSNQVSVGDVLCGSCKGMLFHPVVLNCGHVFCICCVVRHANEMLKCEVCQCPHPGDFPKVYLEFDHFLEEQFPTEYKLRRGNSHMEQEQMPSSSGDGSSSLHTSKSSRKNPLPRWDGTSTVHTGVGCDSCGMYPIVGDRYRCKDCVEEIGYDLCKDCYASTFKLPGRFNQQHTSDHEFEVVTSNAMEVLMQQFHIVSTVSVSDINRELYNVNVDLSEFEEINDESDDDVDPHPPSFERAENESDNEQSHERLL